MANVEVIVLIVIVVLLVIGAGIAIALALISSSNESKDSNNNGTNENNVPTENCSSTVDVDSLLQIPDADVCIQQGQETSKYYIGNLGDQTLDYVVAPWGTSALDVCVGYCDTYSNGTCTGPNNAQANFDACMTQLTPTDCLPPKPIAARGTTLYYAFSPTCGVCDNCG